MKKVGIITILKVNNYGAELQAFALHHKLLQLGFDNEVIDYLYYTNPDHIETKGSQRIMDVGLKNKMKWLGHRVVNYLSKLKGGTNVKTERFRDFHKKNTKLSTTFKTYEELYSADLPYEIYIVGSDQVWNPITHTSLNPYFLTFVKSGKKKISYGSSFGVTQVGKSNKDTYRKLLNNIDVLSCREQAGVDIIKQITDREAVRVLDPTLLLTAKEWENVASIEINSAPYILLYVLRLSPFMKDIVKMIHKATGHNVISIGRKIEPFDEGIKIINAPDAGPAEFIGYFKNAASVITDSYHGSIFSIIFQKPFYTVIPSRKSNNSRQINLMELLGLEDRLVRETDHVRLEEMHNINYQEVEQRLLKERQKSIKYLQAAINS